MKLSEDEIKVINTFDEYFKHLDKSGLLEGIQAPYADDPEKRFVMNVAIAAALTAVKGNPVEDYFA